jgi:KUP system potassium uptake protein
MNRRATAQGALAVGALGVVFRDIGTSPLYTVQTVFNPADPHPVPVSEETAFGIVSLIFWPVTIIVTLTYVLLMRADNNGEGGILALITLIRRRGVPAGTARRSRLRRQESSALRCTSATA